MGKEDAETDFLSHFLVGVTVILSTWIGAQFPVIGETLNCATIRQIKYLHQLSTQRLG